MPTSDVYLGNPNLKRANTAHEFTEEQVIEFLKCKEDPVYFARNYIQIVSLWLAFYFYSCWIFRKLVSVTYCDRNVFLNWH